MTTKPHPTDAMEMPEKFTLVNHENLADSFDAISVDQLRAERIKAYDLALEDAAKECHEQKSYGNQDYNDGCSDCARAIRSLRK